MDAPVKITKVGGDDKPSKIEKELVSTYKPIEVGGKKKPKTLKTFPRGILKKTAKIKPVADPARHPPLKKGMKKHTIRLLSDSSVSHRRKTIKHKISKMSDAKVREVAVRSGLSKGNAPPALLRKMVEGGMMAGFISSE